MTGVFPGSESIPDPKVYQAPKDNSSPIKACPITVSEYQEKFDACVVRDSRLGQVNSVASAIKSYQYRYEQVAAATGVPWQVVGCIHERESSLDLSTYLQNGDPLFDRSGSPIPTTDVPRGIGPFSPQTWVNAAIHALGGQGSHLSAPKQIGYWLSWCESYNGLGYRKRAIASPYLWSFTDQYVKGLYVSDGNFDQNAFDKNPGVASLLKVLGLT